MLKKLFLRKKLNADFVEIDEEHHGLKRHLGWFQLIVIGIGAIIGAGVFVITGTAAAEFAGPAIALSFIFAAIVCVLAGLCYAELASLIPIGGGPYTYSYIALGELPAWIIGWSITAQVIFASSAVATGWSGYFKSFLRDWNITFPEQFSSALLAYDIEQGWFLSGSYFDLGAAALVFLIGIMITIGIKAAAQFNSFMVVIKLCTVALFIILGIPHIDSANLTPFIPENTGHFGEFGWSGIFRAAGLLFFAYIGFDTVSTLAQEAKNPQKDLPRGILGSLAVSTVCYILVAFVLTGVVSYTLLNVPDPMAVALNAMGPGFFWVSSIVKVAILAALASVVLVMLLAQSRVFMAISKDGLLPKAFGQVHPKFRTPAFSSIVTAALTMVLAALFPVGILGQLVSMVTLFIFTIVCVGVLVLRKTHPEFKRSFKVPFVPVIPLLGIVACVSQMLGLPGTTWVQLIIWFAIGIAIYFSYSIRHSKIRINHTAAKD